MLRLPALNRGRVATLRSRPVGDAIRSRPGRVHATVGLVSIAAAIAAASVAASNPMGSPERAAALFRVSTIGFLIVAGICVQPTRIPARMAVLLTCED